PGRVQKGSSALCRACGIPRGRAVARWLRKVLRELAALLGQSKIWWTKLRLRHPRVFRLFV
ncbi:hypothetical protein CSUI_010645, partial [Cystoisospora suis]